MIAGHSGEAFMSAMVALLHLNFGDSSPASWDDRQAASTGHQRIHFLNFDFFWVKFSKFTGHSSAEGKSS